MKWFKDNWLIIVVICIVAGLIYVKFDSSALYDNLMENYIAQGKNFKEQIKELEKINEEQDKQLDAIDHYYKEQLKLIEERYNERLEDIEGEREKEESDIVKKAKKNPKTLTNKVQEVFGIPVYQPSKRSKGAKKQ